MGVFVSRMSSMNDTMMFNTRAHINYMRNLQRQYTTAAATARMETMQQAQIGGGGAGGGGAGGLTNLSRFWLAVSDVTRMMCLPIFIIGVVLALASYLMNLPKIAMGVAAAMVTFPVFFIGFYYNPLSPQYVMTGRVIFVPTVLAVIVGFVIAIVVYSPKE